MDVINQNTVVVYTSLELKNCLEGNNSYNYIYLGDDITLASGIIISSTKSIVTIDGTYNGIRHTYQDMKSTGYGDTISARSSNISKVTVKNIDVTGYNYYGIIYVPEDNSLKDVIIEYNNLKYFGPQITFHPTGLSRYIDCNITINTSYATGNEVAECNRIEIGGNTTILHESSCNSSFWFRGSTSQSFIILEDADVNMTSTNRELFYGTTNLELKIMTKAKFTLTTALGMGYGTYSTGNVLIDKDAFFQVTQTKRNGSYPTWYCNGNFVMNEGSIMIMINNYSGMTTSNYNIYFRTTLSSLTLNNPKKFVLYNTTANVISSDSTINFNLNYERINMWQVAATTDAGSLENLPNFSWYKDNGISIVSGTLTSTKTNITTNNYTEEELLELPALSNFLLTSMKVISIGVIPLKLNAVGDQTTVLKGYTEEGAFVKISYLTNSTIVEANESGYFELTLDESMPIGTEITYLANIKNSFIYQSKTITIVYVGEIVMSNAPNVIRFNLIPISTNPLLCSRLEEIKIDVVDSRIDSTDWKLYVSINHDLTSENELILPDSLVYIGDDDTVIPLSTTPTLVYSGSKNDGEIKTTIIQWETNKGILLQVNKPLQNMEEYTAEVYWNLEE